jgi:hypothetical protein
MKHFFQKTTIFKTFFFIYFKNQINIEEEIALIWISLKIDFLNLLHILKRKL